MDARRIWLPPAAAALALLASPPAEGTAQELAYPGHNYYVTYSCPEWRQTLPTDLDGARDLADWLQGFGAEVRFVGKGVAVDDPEYPTAVFRMAAVKYRLAVPGQRVTPDPRQARRWQARLLRLGFEARLTVDEPFQDFLPPPTAGPELPAVELKARTEWAGTISQEGRLLPARLVLDRRGRDLSGELSFRVGDQTYRARVRGAVHGDAVSFTTYEAVEGRVYVPCEYKATLTGSVMKGTWSYPPEHLEDDFEFVLADE